MIRIFHKILERYYRIKYEKSLERERELRLEIEEGEDGLSFFGFDTTHLERELKEVTARKRKSYERYFYYADKNRRQLRFIRELGDCRTYEDRKRIDILGEIRDEEIEEIRSAERVTFDIPLVENQ